MAYTARGLKIRVFYDTLASEWRWNVSARGTASGEFADDCGTNADLSTAMDECKAAIVARLA